VTRFARPIVAVTVVLAALLICSCGGNAKTPAAATRPVQATTASTTQTQPAATAPAPTRTTSTTSASSTTRSSAPRASASLPVKAGSPDALPSSPATLTLSATSGRDGATVHLSSSDCPAPPGGYVAFFADSLALAHPQIPQLRHVFPATSEGPQTGSGDYQFRADDTPGFGLFEIVCGGTSNALASFTVTGS
jgi:hypothetical protein